MRQLFVTHDKLLSIYASSMYLPYKLQPNLEVVINFKEYKEFVNVLVGNHISLSNMSIANYVNAMVTGEDIGYIKQFYYDTSVVLEKELILSVIHGMDCTMYKATFDDIEETVSCYDYVDRIRSNFSKEDCDRVLGLAPSKLLSVVPDPTKLNEHNYKVYKYCECLRLLSLLNIKAKKINIYY